MKTVGAMLASGLRQKRSWRGLWLGLLVWLGTVALVPLNAALQFDVFLGYDGILHEGNWFPVVCEVANDGPPFNAVFELTSVQFGAGQTRRYAVELPTNTRKRFVVPAFASGKYSVWNARLLDERGKVRAEQPNLRPKRDTAARSFVLGALPRSFSGLPAFPTVAKAQPEVQPSVAFLKPDIFPDNAIALEGLDALYLSSEKALDLKVPQVNALLVWIHTGGHLIVGVEQPTDITGTPWLRSLLPEDFSGAETRTVPSALQAWLHSEVPGAIDKTVLKPNVKMPPRSGMQGMSPAMQRRYGLPAAPASSETEKSDSLNPYADLPADSAFDESTILLTIPTVRTGQVVCAMQDLPVIVSAPYDRGQVTVLNFSPDREPLRSWKNKPWFWARVARVPLELLRPAEQTGMATLSIDGVFGAMIDSKQVRKLPVLWLLVLLVVYLAVIGPVDQYSLKRLNKQMWTWVTFPVYVALFSGLIWLIGYKLRAGETEWNELHVVDVFPNGSRAELRGRTYASVYSPANARFQLMSDLPTATFRGEAQGGSYGSGQEASRAEVEQLNRGFRAEIFVPVWTSQLFEYDWLQAGPLPLSAQITTQGMGFQVTVTNHLNRALSHVRLVMQQRVYTLGELPALKSSSFAFERAQGKLLADFLTEAGASEFANAAQERHRAFGADPSQRIWDMPASVAAASLVGSQRTAIFNQIGYYGFIVPNGLSLGELVDRGYAVLMAWDADHSFAKPIHQFTPRRSQRNTLLRLAIPMHMNPQ